MTIDRVNELERAAFVESLGWIFEDSPWVAEHAWDHRPFDSPEALHEAMAQAVAGASRDEQLMLLRAHPDLGASAGGSEPPTPVPPSPVQRDPATEPPPQNPH